MSLDLAHPTAVSGVITLSMANELVVLGNATLDKNAVEVTMTGSLAVINTITGRAEVVQISGSGSMYQSAKLEGAMSVLELSMDGSGHVVNRMDMDSNILLMSMRGVIVQDDNNVAIDDADYPFIEGETYLVVNLKTKAHSTYKDGERTAVARTASLNFGSFTQKIVGDMFILSRAKGSAEVIVSAGEEKKRHYPLVYGEQTDSGIKSKKLPLARGLKASNWEFEIVVPEDSHMEVRGLDLLVTDTKRYN